MDEFDQFCQHKNQTLLYNLFDVCQSAQVNWSVQFEYIFNSYDELSGSNGCDRINVQNGRNFPVRKAGAIEIFTQADLSAV